MKNSLRQCITTATGDGKGGQSVNRQAPQGCCAPGCTSMKLCNAHIIPRCFARSLSSPGGHNRVVSDIGSKRAKQPLGVFDPEILCASCDGKLGLIDEYAILFCGSLPATSNLPPSAILRHAPFDGAEFARAMLAILWRASISRRDEFAFLDLGPYERRAAAVLFDEAPLSSMPEFDVVLYRYASLEHDARKFIFMPLRIRSGAVNAFVIGLGGFVVWAKMDQRPIDRLVAPYAINAANSLAAPVIEFERSAEYDYFKQAARADRRRRHPG